jgi:transketolase
VERFRAYGWQVIPHVDGHDAEEVRIALETARANTTQPTLICCRTVIGFGSPNKQGKEECHGAPLGADEIALARETLGWKHGPFEVPADIYADWNARKASQNTLDAFGPLLPELTGGSADLGGSNNTVWKGCKSITGEDANGNYIHYGVREFAMTAIMNGMVLHGGMRPYGGTFLVFMEYARNAVRMAALMGQPNILVYTHDSIGLGEDGPTHQPVEQLASLRMTPNMRTWRPCDTVESAVSWKQAILRTDGPSALVFSRQNLPCMKRDDAQLAEIARGGYVLTQTGSGTPEAIIIATGSEVEIAMQAAEKLGAAGKNVRVVSMPCVEEFLAQDQNWQEAVLPSAVRNRVAVEAGIKDYWYRFVGLDGRIIGMSTFGASAPAPALFKHFGITADAVASAVEELI